ncbi:MAG: hypothetical protein R3272_03805, partial [Candidatus Promineifilaceae bacterium]|nr:hypothetical protein [Candidatus Promineifilaceae bacterium]
VGGNPYLTEALEEFEHAMQNRSCWYPDGIYDEEDLELYHFDEYEECDIETRGEEVRFSNSFTDEAMPNPIALLYIDDFQHNMRRVTLVFEVPDPDNPERFLYEYTRTGYRHELSNYESETRLLQ